MSCQAEEIQNLLETASWQEFSDIYQTQELELENRDQGGVRIRQDSNIAEDQFHFSIEEIRSQYSSFLNPEKDSQENQSQVNTESEQTMKGFEDFTEIDDPIVKHDIIHGRNLGDPDFNEGIFWKSDISKNYDIDELLNEQN